ncbi:MAG: hypothetical protein OEY75_01710 [Hylemonella sp.]|nr:hypothetical protein [Hylemonella sp.]
MIKHATRTLCLLLLPMHLAWAQQSPPPPKADTEEKVISGMSIVGNNETPKSLTIVPWKSSEIGQESDFQSSLLNGNLDPVDRETFKRELDFYHLSNPN